MKKEDNFKINLIGFPKGDEYFEDYKSSKKKSTPHAFDPRYLLDIFNLEKEAFDFSLFQKEFMEKTEVPLFSINIEKSSDEIKKIFNSLTKNPNKDFSTKFENGKIEFLFNTNNFGVVPFKKNSSLYSDFCKNFGLKKEFDFKKEFMEKKILITSAEGKDEILDELRSVEIEDINEDYILLKGNFKNKDFQEIYLATFLGKDKKFQILFPVYGNPFNFLDNRPFSKKDDKELFDSLGNFKNLNLNKIKTGIELLLVEIKNPITSVNDFGIIKTRFLSDSEEFGNSLLIGKIISNGSKAAEDFKRDFSLIGDSYDFFVKFDREYNSEELNIIKRIFSKLNFNKNFKIENSDLRCKKGKIFIEINLGTIPTRLVKWLKEKGEN